MKMEGRGDLEYQPLQQKWLPQFGNCDLKNRQADQQIEQ